MSITAFIDEFLYGPVAPVSGRTVHVCSSCNNSGWTLRPNPRPDELRWTLCAECIVPGLAVAA